MLGLLLTLVVVGVVLYLVEQYVPMAAPIKTLIRIVVVLALVIYLLQAFGIADLPVPRVR